MTAERKMTTCRMCAWRCGIGVHLHSRDEALSPVERRKTEARA